MPDERTDALPGAESAAPLAGTAEHLAVRLRAALNLLYPDDITPSGKRIIESVINDELEQHGGRPSDG